MKHLTRILLVVSVLFFGAPTAKAASLADEAYKASLNLMDQGQPVMVRDLINGDWLYGGVYVLPWTLPLDLPALDLPVGGISIDLPRTDFDFGFGVVAPVDSQAGTPILNGSANLTPATKAALLAALSKLPTGARDQLDFLTRMLNTENSDGKLTLGFAGGYDLNESKWRGGVSLRLSVAFSNLFPKVAE